jgi:uncharacterized protein YndB with AHSA1/START domain
VKQKKLKIMAIDKTLIKTVNINATPKKVWEALTKSKIIKKWLFGTNVISDWKPGSSIFFTGNWQGTEYKDKGTILQLEKEKVFQYNYWSSFSGLSDTSENYSSISFELTPVPAGTQLTLKHSHFPTETGYEHSDKNWDATLALMKEIIEK